MRGAVSLLFGILAALWPGLTLMWFIVLFAAYAIIGGFASISTALQNRKSNSDWWLPLLSGTDWPWSGSNRDPEPRPHDYSLGAFDRSDRAGERNC